MQLLPPPSVERRLSKAIWRLIETDPFLGFLGVDVPSLVIDDTHPIGKQCKTACTDYRKIYYHRDFITKLSDRALVFVVAHEICHILLRHCDRCQQRNQQRWNTATDYVINGKLDDTLVKSNRSLGVAEFPTLPDPNGVQRPIGLLKEEYKQLVSEQVYEMLGQQPPPNSNKSNGSEKGNPDENWDIILQAAEADDGNENQTAINQEIAERVAGALVKAQRHRENRNQGTKPSDWERMAEEGFKPQVNWVEHLRQNLQASGKGMITWRRPNRKQLPHGYYLPSATGISYGVLGAVIDTSGSIMDTELGQYLSELNSLLSMGREIAIHLWTCDADLHYVGQFGPYRRIPPNLGLKGGGGTDFRPAFEAAHKLPGLHTLVYFTDTYGTFPEHQPRFKTIWVIPEQHGKDVPFGTQIRIPIFKE